MADKAWKQRERDAAAIFGARRNVLSGSSGRDDRDSSDSTHPRLRIETKLKASHSIFTLWRKVWRESLKTKDHNPPVLMLAEKSHDGFLVCVHHSDLEIVFEEWCVVQSDETLNDLCERIRQRRIEREKT